MTEKNALPEVVDKTEAEIEEIIQLIRDSNLKDATKKFVIKCIQLAIWFPLQLEQKNISLSRLRRLIFGKGYHRDDTSTNNKGDEGDEANNSEESDKDTSPIDKNTPTSSDKAEDSSTKEIITSSTTPSDEETNTDSKPKKTGHGRMPHTVYKNADEITLSIDSLQAGDPCPQECSGTLSKYRPGVLIRIKGQNIAKVLRYHIEKLRCSLCGYLYTAELPSDIGKEKYDPSFKAMLAILKYFVAIPFYRQENFQKSLGFPLPDSTQWNLIEKLAGYCYVIFEALKIYAANGEVIHNDDTRLKILEVIQEIKAGHIENDRVGMFTTGVIAEHEGHKIALFLNGTQHAGENLEDILKNRRPEKPLIIQMCDASNNNIPKSIKTILCNCLSHGFRKFDELIDYFPEECLIIMKALGQVYKYDADTKEMDKHARLSYHKEHSAPVMEALLSYMSKLLDEHLVEPNSELGKAIRYMQKHWPELTKFLSVAGAPIDNNIVERALKIAIRNRKSAMFYRTRYSAGIGGMLTSLIYTAHLADENPHDYLIALQEYQDEILKSPQKWFPWNYKKTLQTILHEEEDASKIANPQAHSPPEDHLAAV